MFRYPETMIVTYHLRIRGRVQGVGFRHYMTREARRRGVAGWVRNRIDGSVEAVVQGGREAVDALIEWARRGPPSASVADVEVSEDSGMFEGFEQRPTE
ncbi:MAG: acylphosphatase [Burkholderiales bacterium]